MAGALKTRGPVDSMCPSAEGGGLKRGDSVHWGVWILSLPERKGKGRGKSSSQGRFRATIICPGPQRKRDNWHVNAVRGTEVIGICQWSRREFCLIGASKTQKKTNNKTCRNANVFDIQGVIFTDTALSILSKWFPPVGHCAIVKQLVLSDEDIPHPQKHARQQKEMMENAFFAKCEVSVRCPWVQKITL